MTSTNDGKDVKSNQTSGQKGKSYYIELYKSLEARLSTDCELHERTQHLCEAWRRIHSLCQHSAPSTHPHLLGWLQRHTARTVLQAEWRSQESKEHHNSLSQAINDFIEECHAQSRDGDPPPWETQLIAGAEGFKKTLVDPWGHGTLKVLCDPDGKPTDEEVIAWLREERGIVFVTRLRQLATSKKCEDLALSLSSAVMDRVRATLVLPTDAEQAADVKDKPKVEIKSEFAKILEEEAGFTPDVWELLTDIELVLLHKGDKTERCIELAKQTPLRNGYQLVERLSGRLENSPREKRLWKNAKEVAKLIAQMVITRCMVLWSCAGACRFALYWCARALCRLLGAALCARGATLAATAATAAHLHTLAAAVHAESTEEMKAFVCELYVRALTAGMNELERLKIKTDKESEARSAETTLATWFSQLGALLSSSERVRCECLLTAFSVHPSPNMFDRIRAAPALPPVALDSQDPKEESTSEFGSWASDSRSQTNLVKTSETLNLKQTKHQANVLSTAILTEGESLGLSPDLCQDIAVLLSGPRLKTLSWDMDRELLLENCRTYMERTNFGTRALTTELKYLNLDPRHYQHLPEEEDDESDMYYGIEKGYEHLVEEYREPEEIWQDAEDFGKTETALSSDLEIEVMPVRKKRCHKKKRIIVLPDEEVDPLSTDVEAKRSEKKKERPHSKERSKERKPSKSKPIKDPLDLTEPLSTEINNEQEPGEKKESIPQEKKEKVPKEKKEKVPKEKKEKIPKEKKEKVPKEKKVRVPKEKKERVPKAKKEKVPKEKRERKKKAKQADGIVSSLSNLIGMRVSSARPGVPVIDSDYNTPANSSLTSSNFVETESNVLFDGHFSMDEIKSPEKTKSPNKDDKMGLMRNNEFYFANGSMRINPHYKQQSESQAPTPQVPNKTLNNVWDLHSNEFYQKYQPQQQNQQKLRTVSPEVKDRVTKLIQFRRQKAMSESERCSSSMSNASTSSNNSTPKTSNLTSPQTQQFLLPQASPKPAHTAEPPKVSINQSQSEKIAELRNEMNTLVNINNRMYGNTKPVIQYGPTSTSSVLKQHFHTMVSQELNMPTKPKVTPPVTNDMRKSATRTYAQNKSQETSTSPRDLNYLLKDLRHTIHASSVDNILRTSTETVKKDIKPISRLTPVMPSMYSESPKSSPISAKPAIVQKKPDVAPNTFSRLSYLHKNKIDAKQKEVIDAIIQQQKAAIEDEKKRNEFKRMVMEQYTTFKQKNTKRGAKINNKQKNISNDSIINRGEKNIPIKFSDNLSSQITKQVEKPSTTTSKLVKDHPVIANSLKAGVSLANKPITRVDNDIKSGQVIRSSSHSTPLSASTFTEKDHHDLLLLLRNKQNLSLTVPKGNKMKEKIQPVSTTLGNLPMSNINPVPCSSTQAQTNNKILEAPSLSYGNDKIKANNPKMTSVINNCTGVSLQATPLNMVKTDVNFTKTAKQTQKIQLNDVSSPRSASPIKATDWESVMDSLLSLKTINRDGTKAQATDLHDHKKMRTQPVEQRIQIPSSKEHLEIQKTPNIIEGYSKTVMKRINKQNPVKDTTDRKNIKKQSNTTVPKPTLNTAEEPSSSRVSLLKPSKSIQTNIRSSCVTKDQVNVTKKTPAEVLMKQYPGPLSKTDDPFISGLVNPDFSLLEELELMDDELRQEIGELSSDEESFKQPTQSIKNPKIVSKTAVVQQEKRIVNPALLNVGPTHSQAVNKLASKINIENITITKPALQPIIQVRHPTTFIQDTTQVIQPANIIQQLPKNIIISTKTGNPTLSLNTEPPRIIEQTIVAVPQQTTLQNVVLIGSEIVYQPTPINLAQNTFVAFNSQPNMALYQTTQFAAPVINPLIIGNAMTSTAPPKIDVLDQKIPNIPVLSENQKPIVVDDAPEPTKRVTQTSEPAKVTTAIGVKYETLQNNVTNDPQDFRIDPKNCQLDNSTQDTSTNKTANDDNTMKYEKLDINCNKNCERKVLSEVQEKLIFSEKTDMKTKSRRLSYELDTKKETSKDTERLKKKRMAILNRNINHRSEKNPIPLTYTPLFPKKLEIEEKEKDNAKNTCRNRAVVDNKTALSKLNSLIQSNMITLKRPPKSKEITIETNKNEQYKENKNDAPCRRILLRSNKTQRTTITTDTEEITKNVKLKLTSKDGKTTPVNSVVKNIKPNKSAKKTVKKITKKNVKMTPKRNAKLKSNVNSTAENIPEIKRQNWEASTLSNASAEVETVNKSDPNVNGEHITEVSEFTDIDVEEKIKGSLIRNQREVVENETDVKSVDFVEMCDIEEELVGAQITKSIPTNHETKLQTDSDSESAILEYESEDSRMSTILTEPIQIPEIIRESVLPDNDVPMKAIDKKEEQSIELHEFHNNVPTNNISDVDNSSEHLKSLCVTKESDSLKKIVVTNSENLLENSHKQTDSQETSANRIDTSIKKNSEITTSNKNNNIAISKLIDEIAIKSKEKNKKLTNFVGPKEAESILNSLTTTETSNTNKLKDMELTTTTATEKSNLRTEDSEVICLEDDAPNSNYEESSLSLTDRAHVEYNASEKFISSAASNTSATRNTSEASNKTCLTEKKNDTETIYTNNASVITINPTVKNKQNTNISITQDIRENIKIEHLPQPKSGDPLKKVLRITLPSGKVFKATVHGHMHTNIDSLFSDPALKSVIMGDISKNQRYTLNIKQLPPKAAGKSSTPLIQEIRLQVPKQLETIDLLSDSDEEDTRDFNTEFGKYKIKEMKRKIFEKHQETFAKKCVVKLKKLVKEELPEDSEKDVTAKSDSDVLVPDVAISLRDKKAEFQNEPSNQPEDIIEIDDSSSNEDSILPDSPMVRYEENAKPTEEKLEEKINQFKNLLLNDLGIKNLLNPLLECDLNKDLNLKNDKTSITDPIKPVTANDSTERNNENPASINMMPLNTSTYAEEYIVPIDVSRIEENLIVSNSKLTDATIIQKQIAKDNRSLINSTDLSLSSTEVSKTCPRNCCVEVKKCDDLYKKIKSIKQCSVKLIRCDEDVINSNDIDRICTKNVPLEFPSVTLLEPMDSGVLSRSGSYSTLNELGPFEDEELDTSLGGSGISSPVMEAYDAIISSIRPKKTDEKIQSYNEFTCQCDWFITKRQIYLNSQDTKILKSTSVVLDDHSSNTLYAVSGINIDNGTAHKSDLSNVRNVPSLKQILTSYLNRDLIINQIAYVRQIIYSPCEMKRMTSNSLKRKSIDAVVNEDIKISKFVSTNENVIMTANEKYGTTNEGLTSNKNVEVLLDNITEKDRKEDYHNHTSNNQDVKGLDYSTENVPHDLSSNAEYEFADVESDISKTEELSEADSTSILCELDAINIECLIKHHVIDVDKALTEYTVPETVHYSDEYAPRLSDETILLTDGILELEENNLKKADDIIRIPHLCTDKEKNILSIIEHNAKIENNVEGQKQSKSTANVLAASTKSINPRSPIEARLNISSGSHDNILQDLNELTHESKICDCKIDVIENIIMQNDNIQAVENVQLTPDMDSNNIANDKNIFNFNMQSKVKTLFAYAVDKINSLEVVTATHTKYPALTRKEEYLDRYIDLDTSKLLVENKTIKENIVTEDVINDVVEEIIASTNNEITDTHEQVILSSENNFVKDNNILEVNSDISAIKTTMLSETISKAKDKDHQMSITDANTDLNLTDQYNNIKISNNNSENYVEMVSTETKQLLQKSDMSEKITVVNNLENHISMAFIKSDNPEINNHQVENNYESTVKEDHLEAFMYNETCNDTSSEPLSKVYNDDVTEIVPINIKVADLGDATSNHIGSFQILGNNDKIKKSVNILGQIDNYTEVLSVDDKEGPLVNNESKSIALDISNTEEASNNVVSSKSETMQPESPDFKRLDEEVDVSLKSNVEDSAILRKLDVKRAITANLETSKLNESFENSIKNTMESKQIVDDEYTTDSDDIIDIANISDKEKDNEMRTDSPSLISEVNCDYNSDNNDKKEGCLQDKNKNVDSRINYEDNIVENNIEMPNPESPAKDNESDSQIFNYESHIVLKTNTNSFEHTLKVEPVSPEDEDNVFMKKIRIEDPELAKYVYVFPPNSLHKLGDISQDNVFSTIIQASKDSIVEEPDLKLIVPKFTYSKNNETSLLTFTSRRRTKRKADMNEVKVLHKKYRKGKNIDYPKLTLTSMRDTSYLQEFKRLEDYCSSVKFSYSRPFHKEYIDVDSVLKAWPIQGICKEPESETENDKKLFVDIENIGKTFQDPLKQTLSEEIVADYSENNYSYCDITENNFNMGFGEGSGRVIQNFGEGCGLKFSAATLSDVKQIQPFLLSENYSKLRESNSLYNNQLKCIQLKNKVRSFFKKTMVELNYDCLKQHKKEDADAFTINCPFDLVSSEFIAPAPIEAIVQVVQVGQLPVSAAAQNPVTCDPRVTQVSDASPSQCSAENSLNDDPQSAIKTEYTELTTADFSLQLSQDYAQHIQSMPVESQETTINMSMCDNNETIDVIKTEIKEELEDLPEIKQEEPEVMENYESPQPPPLEPNNIVMNNFDYSSENNATKVHQDTNSNMMFNSADSPPVTEAFIQQKQQVNGSPDKSDQIAHAMSAAGITTAESMSSTRAQALVNMLNEKLRQNAVASGQSPSNAFSKTTSINAMALQQALAQILPPPLNPTSSSENNQQNSNTTVTQQVLHIVQGKNASGGNQITLVDGNNQPSVINTPNATPVLHIVQNKGAATGSTSNGTSATQTNTFGGLSLVDAGLQQGNQLLHIVNTGNQKNSSAGQLLKRVNLLTNLANVQGSNEQKMVQFVCKSADGKPIQLNTGHQRSMVLRLQPFDTPNLQSTQQKPMETPELSPTSTATNNINNISAKETVTSQQEIKSRSVYEENYAKFIQNSSSKTTIPEKSTSLPKFGQAFGKQVFQDGNQNKDIGNNNVHLSSNGENTECSTNENNINLEHIGQISSPPLLLHKSPAQTSQAQSNLVQQLKQSIAPMNMTMHGGVIYTRQIPVNLSSGQTINLITVPSTELVDESAPKQQGDVKFINQNEIEPSIIKIVPQTQTATNPEVSAQDDNARMGMSNENSHAPQTQPQPVLTQMRIKLPMLSKTPQMVSGARVVRPSFFQIQRNVIGGPNQPVYQQLVLTAAPPLGQQTIRLPQTQTSTRPVKVPSESQSSTESMSSSTLEQLREFDLVLEQVKERSTATPNATATSAFSKLHTSSTDTTDSPAPSNAKPAETSQQVLYSIGNSQPLNVAYVNRKNSTSTPSTSSFVRSPDSSGIIDSPTSSTHVHVPHTVTSEASTSDAPPQPKSTKSKSKSRPKASSNPPNTLKLNTVTPKTSSQKPLEDEQTTQRILYILAEYKEQVENSPDKDKPAPRRRTNPPSNPSGSHKRRKCSGSRRHGRDMSPIHGDETCRTMGSEDSSCGTSQGDCNESCLDSHSPQDSPRKVVRKLTFENENAPIPQPRPQPQRNVIVADGQTITVARGTAGKPATAVLMPANYILPVSMVKSGQQIAIVTNRGPKLLTVSGGEGGATNALLLQRLISPAGLKPMLTRPGVRHVRLPTSALHNLQAFNLATATTIHPPGNIASSISMSNPPELIETRANSSPWADRGGHDVKPERGSSPEGSEPWNLASSADPHDYGYEETVRTDNMDRTVLDPIPDRYSPDMEAQRIFDKMFDIDSKKTYMVDSHDDSPRCGYDLDASDCDDKAYHQVVHKKDGGHRRLTHVSAAALRHKYAILEHELRLQKSLSEECEDLGVDSPSAAELFPEAELLFSASPAHDHTQDAQGHHSHTPQPMIHQSGIPHPDMDDQIATDQLLPRPLQDARELGLGLEDVGIVTVSEDGLQATIQLDQEEFARSHPNTTFHSEPTDEGVVQPFTISGLKGRHITSTIFHANRTPGTVLMAPQTTVISQATAETSGHGTVKYADIDNMINSLPGSHSNNINLSSVLVKDDGLARFDHILNDTRELHLSHTASAIVHSAGNATQVIRRVCYDDDRPRDRDHRFLIDEPDALIAGDDAKMIADDSRDLESMVGDVDDDRSTPERTELFWDSNSVSERSESRRPLDYSSDSDKCCKSPSYDETNSTDSSGVGTHMRLDSVIKDARGLDRSASADGSSADDAPPLRTYPAKRAHAAERAHPAERARPAERAARSVSGKTRAGEREPDELRRRASGRGVVKRGCLCCTGEPAPRPKKPRQRKPTVDFATN